MTRLNPFLIFFLLLLIFIVYNIFFNPCVLLREGILEWNAPERCLRSIRVCFTLLHSKTIFLRYSFRFVGAIPQSRS